MKEAPVCEAFGKHMTHRIEGEESSAKSSVEVLVSLRVLIAEIKLRGGYCGGPGSTGNTEMSGRRAM